MRQEDREAEIAQLKRFYGVKHLSDLVLAQAKHIERLQAKLPQTPDMRPATWFDGGYLGNGHCSFMWARNGSGACCCLLHGHEGPHVADPARTDKGESQ